MDKRLVRQIKADRRELDWIAKERIKDELMKMAALPGFARSCEHMMVLGVLPIIFPKIEDLCVHGARRKDMWDHTLQVLNRVEADPRATPLLKLTALLHDIGKPMTAQFHGNTWTFDSHEQAGATHAKGLLRRLTFGKSDVERVGRIIELHQTPMQLDAAKRAGLRRFINKAGGVLEDLLVLAEHDHTTRNTQKQTECYQRIAELRERISETMAEDDYARFQLQLGGERICELLGLSPSPVIGRIKTYLTELVMSGVINNDPPALEQLVIHLKEIINCAESHQDRHCESQRAAA
jgi:poly(A) polymerase